LSHRSLRSQKRHGLGKCGKCGTVRDTYDNDDVTHPHKLFVQQPNPITEESLSNERNDRGYDGKVYGGEMGMREAFHVAISGDKPIVDIAPSQRSLNGLQQKDEISCSELVFKT